MKVPLVLLYMAGMPGKTRQNRTQVFAHWENICYNNPD